MAKLYRRTKSKNWYASVLIWSETNQEMVRKRVSTETDDKEKAQDFADGLETVAKATKSLAGKTISKQHAHGIFLTFLSTAGITIEGDRPLPGLLAFLNDFLESRKDKVSVSSYNTYRSARNRFQKWLDLQNLGNPPSLDWFTPLKAEEYYIWLLETLAPKSANESLKWVSRAMTRALKITDLEKNPCDNVELTTKGETLDRLPFSLQEAFHIVGWLLEQGEREREWGRCAALSLMSGCRIEDAITMDQKQISDGVLSYVQKKTGKSISCPLVVPEWISVIIETKEGPISPRLHKELTQWGNADLSSEFTKYVERAGVEQEFKTFKSGCRIARKTFHSLRHTLRTSIVSSGGSDAQADIILGHSEGEGKRYTHSELGAMRATLKKALDST